MQACFLKYKINHSNYHYYYAFSLLFSFTIIQIPSLSNFWSLNKGILVACFLPWTFKEKKGSASDYGAHKTAMMRVKIQYVLEIWLTLVLLFFTGCQKGPQENMERKWHETASKIWKKS